jgi:hypothetical protein
MKQPKTSFCTSHKVRVVHVIVHTSFPTIVSFLEDIIVLHQGVTNKGAVRAMLELPDTECKGEG